MTLLLATLGAPILLLALALGAGLLLDRLTGGGLPGSLLAPVGLALLIVIGQLCTAVPSIAPVTPYAVAISAAAGLAVGRRRLRLKSVDWLLVAACAVAFAVCVAPVLLSGRVTLPGYLLDSTVGIHLAGADYVIEHGRDFSALPSSSSHRTLEGYFGQQYPTGGHIVLATLGRLTGQELVWLFQPFLSLVVALCTPSLFVIARRAHFSRGLAAVAAVLASVPALVYAYLQMGAIKEITVLPIILLLGALIALDRELPPRGVRRWGAAVVAWAGGIGAIGVAFAPWIAVTGLAFLGLSLVRGDATKSGARRLAIQFGLAASLTALLALPTVFSLSNSLGLARSLSQSNAAATADPGNLLRPLPEEQVMGIWLTGSHRLDPVSHLDATYALIGTAVLAAVLGVGYLAKRRAWPVLAYVVLMAFLWWALTQRGTAWTDAKLLVLSSPLAAFLAFAGVQRLLRAGWRTEGIALAAMLAIGVLVSDAFTYRDTNLLPTERFEELLSIGDRFRGDSAALLPDFDEYAYYALGDVGVDGPGFANPGPLVSLATGEPAYARWFSLNRLTLDSLEDHSLIVTKRSPEQARPPSNFSIVYDGRWYQAWRRGGGPRPQERLVSPAAPMRHVPCRRIRALATKTPMADARLAYALAPTLQVLDPRRSRRPPGWKAGRQGGIGLSGPGALTKPFFTSRAGAYRLWLKGDFSRALSIRVDGREVGRVAYETGGEGHYAKPLDVELQPGAHVVELERGGGSLRPGDNSPSRLLSIVLEPAETSTVRWLPTSRWRSLCGRGLDWIEIIRPSDDGPS